VVVHRLHALTTLVPSRRNERFDEDMWSVRKALVRKISGIRSPELVFKVAVLLLFQANNLDPRSSGVARKCAQSCW